MVCTSQVVPFHLNQLIICSLRLYIFIVYASPIQYQICCTHIPTKERTGNETLMAANIMLIVAAASLLFAGSVVGDGILENQLFHVAGKVLCQDCDQGWNEWVNGAKPIKGFLQILDLHSSCDLLKMWISTSVITLVNRVWLLQFTYVTSLVLVVGSKVSVTCLDERNRVVQYASDLTDEAGDFDIACNKYINGKKLNPQNCFLRLVSSPDPVCNIATNFAGGKSGVKLQRPNVVYRDLVKYVLGSFYYTTPMCDEPDTSATPDEDDSSPAYDDDVKQSNY